MRSARSAAADTQSAPESKEFRGAFAHSQSFLAQSTARLCSRSNASPRYPPQRDSTVNPTLYSHPQGSSSMGKWQDFSARTVNGAPDAGAISQRRLPVTVRLRLLTGPLTTTYLPKVSQSSVPSKQTHSQFAGVHLATSSGQSKSRNRRPPLRSAACALEQVLLRAFGVAVGHKVHQQVRAEDRDVVLPAPRLRDDVALLHAQVGQGRRVGARELQHVRLAVHSRDLVPRAGQRHAELAPAAPGLQDPLPLVHG